MSYVLAGNTTAQFAPGSHAQTVGPPSTGARQLAFKLNGIPAVVNGDTVSGNRISTPNDFGVFPIIAVSHFKIGGIPVAKVGQATAPPGFGVAGTSGGNLFFAV